MSSYSTSLKASYFDPRTDISGLTSEFRLDPNTAYMSNLRLANLGFTTTQQHGVSDAVGFYGIIKNIRLMDGNIELSSLREANRWLSFMAVNGTNQDNLSVNGVLSKNAVGYVLDNTEQVQNPAIFDKVSHTTLNDADLYSAHGHLPLEKVFPLLSKLPYLDTAIFENLKVVIEYEKDVRKVSRTDNTGIEQTLSPVLIADEVRDPDQISGLRKTLGRTVWYEIENDQFFVPAKDTTAQADGVGVEVETNATLNGFDNKFVSRVLMMKNYSDLSDAFDANNVIRGFGPYAALNMFRSKTQIRLNGSNVFPGDGLDRDAERAMLLSQTWGSVNIVPFGNQQNVGNNFSDVTTGNSSGVPTLEAGKVSQKVGQQDYIGFQIDGRINQLQVNFKRTCVRDTGDNRNNVALDVFCFAEVLKAISFEGMSYNIQYA